jgi:hypothetical protein
MSAVGPVLFDGPPLLRFSLKQMYARPKNGLDAALSAQIRGLSSSSVELCFAVITTGGIQLDFCFTLVGVGLSSRDTATAKDPLIVDCPEKLGARFS